MRAHGARSKSRDACAVAIALIAVLCMQQSARAQDRFSGGWRIEKSEPAPWVDKPGMLEESEVRRLVGADLDITKNRIEGPEPLACKMPHYEIKRYRAEGLFEGGLGEIADIKVSADQIATKLGFRERPIPSLVTGCAAEIEYHAIDNDHLIFALNNSLYRLTRTRAAPAVSKP